MNRRAFIDLAGLAACSAFLPSNRSVAENSVKRPNIIFLLTDDQRDDTFGAMGHGWVQTPNIDKLVRGGIRFSNAYIAEPTCCPSRVAFFTGMHERVNGVGFTSSYSLNEEQWSRSYPALLRQNGYFTGFIGKFGVEYYTFNRPANENPKLRGHPIYGDLYRDLDIEIPEETGTDPGHHIPSEIMDNAKGRRKTYSYNYSREQCREHHIRYYQQITGLDKVVGDLVDGLAERGLDDDTVIIFASDHGLLMGEYGMGGKALLYDLAAKFPCFIYDPRLPESSRGRDIPELVSSLDITSTILDYARVDQPEEMEGRSLRPLMVGNRGGDWRRHIFLENLYTGRDTPFSEGIRMGKWKYIRMFDGIDPYKERDVDFSGSDPDFEQLFDLEKDPCERDNLIDEYDGDPILSKLRNLCSAESEALNRRRRQYMSRHEVKCR